MIEIVEDYEGYFWIIDGKDLKGPYTSKESALKGDKPNVIKNCKGE